MGSLEDQGNKLNNIENNLDNINQDLKSADKAISSMEVGCFGGIFRQRIIKVTPKNSI